MLFLRLLLFHLKKSSTHCSNGVFPLLLFFNFSHFYFNAEIILILEKLQMGRSSNKILPSFSFMLLLHPPHPHPFSTFFSCTVTRGEVGVGGMVAELILWAVPPPPPPCSFVLQPLPEFSQKGTGGREAWAISSPSPLTLPDTSSGSFICDYNACKVVHCPGSSSHWALVTSFLARPFKPRVVVGFRHLLSWVASVLLVVSLSPASLLGIVPSKFSSDSQLSMPSNSY